MGAPGRGRGLRRRGRSEPWGVFLQGLAMLHATWCSLRAAALPSPLAETTRRSSSAPLLHRHDARPVRLRSAEYQWNAARNLRLQGDCFRCEDRGDSIAEHRPDGDAMKVTATAPVIRILLLTAAAGLPATTQFVKGQALPTAEAAG